MKLTSKIAMTAIAAALMGMGGAASAGKPAYVAPTLSGTACSITDVSPNALACAGFYNGNVNNNNGDDAAWRAALFKSLTWVTTEDYGSPTAQDNKTSDNQKSYSFATPLYGQTILGLHFGGGTGGPGNGTAFYLFNFSSPRSLLSWDYNAWSNVAIYKTGTCTQDCGSVPVPGTIALLGLGMLGLGAARRKLV